MAPLFASVWSATLAGIDGVPVRVEVDVAGGLPGLEIVGLPDASVREARHRVKSAIRNCGLSVPPRRITVNLSPAFIHKEGSQLDLAIATGLLAASGQIPDDGALGDHCLLGELALDGTVRGIRGALSMVCSAAKEKRLTAVIPKSNQQELSFLESNDVKVVENLGELVAFFRGERPLGRGEGHPSVVCSDTRGTELGEIRGQMAAKRALQVACSGNHNLLLSGPPGAGKSMLAKAIPGLLPDMLPSEILEVTKIHSVAGMVLPGMGPVTARPFRSPHHTATSSALLGGGAIPRPGEVSLAHLGVLYLDELPEFAPSVLNALRQPLEDGWVVVTRSRARYKFPCRFLLIASMNPCPCGFYGETDHKCTCTEYARRQYAGRISGPFLDRIDIHLEVARIPAQDLAGPSGKSSKQTREAIQDARERQAQRLLGTGMRTNGEMGPSQVSTLATFSSSAKKLALSAYSKMNLSTRGYYKVLKVAVSVSDLEGSPRVEEEHVAEALSYRARRWPG